MKGVYDYEAVDRLDMLDPKFKTINKLNVFALISIMASCVVGVILNYCLRMLGQHGGMYAVYIICGFVLCLVYPYVHELAHAVAVIACTGKAPTIKFGKLAAFCGSPDIVFGKAKYFFVVSFPFLLYSALLVPLCVLLPAQFFPIPFMPLMYNVFGSTADLFMFKRALKAPRRSLIVDRGTDVVMYKPIEK